VTAARGFCARARRFYLAAALLKDTRLVTADRQLVAKAAAHPYLANRAIMLGH
jgi:hypothetical protein